MMKRIAFFGVICLFLGSSTGFAVDGSKLTVKSEKIEAPKELKEGFRSLLSEDAIQISDGDGKPFATIWFRKEIPAKATSEQVKNGLTYREIVPATFIGAISLPQSWSDFRKQEIPKGVYTLRMGIQPMDGDHQGTAPYNEFVLLSPAEKDTKPDPMAVKALQELSASSHGSTHPAVLLLFPNPKPEETPKLANKGSGIFVVNLKRPVSVDDQKTTLGFALVLVGHTTE
jgi:hypothetical protein